VDGRTTEIVDSIWGHLALVRLADFEVVNSYWLGFAFDLPIAPAILEVPDQFLLRVWR
jgi:hypothetical protein